MFTPTMFSRGRLAFALADGLRTRVPKSTYIYIYIHTYIASIYLYIYISIYPDGFRSLKSSAGRSTCRRRIALGASVVLPSCVYIYIYIEREREIYMYIYIHTHAIPYYVMLYYIISYYVIIHVYIYIYMIIIIMFIITSCVYTYIYIYTHYNTCIPPSWILDADV